MLDADGKLISITVKKGAVDPENGFEKAHAVDGLAGATITGNGLAKGLRADLNAFKKYLYE